MRRLTPSGRSELVLVYGRKRIGKTYLLSFLQIGKTEEY